jgi:prepilin-type N-terminal cleavage/methylation domain-containing protein
VRRDRGFTLLELIVAMSVFGVFLVVFFILTAEMRSWEKRLPVNFMRNPQVISTVARLRRDVQDMFIVNANPYDTVYEGYTNTNKTLVFESQQPSGGVQKIIWDFREPGTAKRIAVNVGAVSEWHARGLPPDFVVNFDAVELPGKGRPWGVRIRATDKNGRISIDQILQPRAHQ